MTACCRSCGAEIVWAVTASGRNMPVDAAPSDAGTITLTQAGTKNRAEVSGPPNLLDDRPRHTSHLATCEFASSHRKPRKKKDPTVKTAMLAVIACVAATLAIFALPAPASATPGKYTRGGDVLVTVAVAGGCATVTWPKGTTTTLCDDYDQFTQTAIEPGDRFGAKITSTGGTSCSVVDIDTGDVIHQDAASGGTSDCMRSAVA